MTPRSKRLGQAFNCFSACEVGMINTLRHARIFFLYRTRMAASFKPMLCQLAGTVAVEDLSVRHCRWMPSNLFDCDNWATCRFGGAPNMEQKTIRWPLHSSPLCLDLIVADKPIVRGSQARRQDRSRPSKRWHSRIRCTLRRGASRAIRQDANRPYMSNGDYVSHRRTYEVNWLISTRPERAGGAPPRARDRAEWPGGFKGHPSILQRFEEGTFVP